jgi:hypothetical protein
MKENPRTFNSLQISIQPKICCGNDNPAVINPNIIQAKNKNTP